VQNSKKSFFSRWRGQMNMIHNTVRSVDTVTTLEITHKPRPPVRVPPLVSSTKDGKPYERPAHVQAEIRKMLSLPQSRWIGEAENLQNETLVFLIRKTRHVNDDLCGGLLTVLGYKRVLFNSADTGSILTLEGEIDMPTGNRTQKLGSRPPGKMRYTCATLAAG